MQKALKEDGLQLGEKPKMQVDTDPLKVEEALYAKPFEVIMVEATDGFDMKAEEGLQADYPHADEDLIDFLEK